MKPINIDTIKELDSLEIGATMAFNRIEILLKDEILETLPLHERLFIEENIDKFHSYGYSHQTLCEKILEEENETT